jgi:hypothetical protein
MIDITNNKPNARAQVKKKTNTYQRGGHEERAEFTSTSISNMCTAERKYNKIKHILILLHYFLFFVSTPSPTTNTKLSMRK